MRAVSLELPFGRFALALHALLLGACIDVNPGFGDDEDTASGTGSATSGGSGTQGSGDTTTSDGSDGSDGSGGSTDGLLFYDGFESGAWQGWSAELNADDELSVVSSPAAEGNHALAIDVDDLPNAYLESATVDGIDRLRIELQVHVGALNLEPDSWFEMLALYDGDEDVGLEFRVYRDSSSTLKMLYVTIDDNGEWTNSQALVVQPDRWYAVTIEWERASAPGVADGHARAWIAGLPVDDIAFENGASPPVNVRFGHPLFFSGTVSGTYHLDEVRIWDGSIAP